MFCCLPKCKAELFLSVAGLILAAPLLVPLHVYAQGTSNGEWLTGAVPAAIDTRNGDIPAFKVNRGVPGLSSTPAENVRTPEGDVATRANSDAPDESSAVGAANAADSTPASDSGESSSRSFFPSTPNSTPSGVLPGAIAMQPAANPEKIQWKSMFVQQLSMVTFEHAWRAAFDPGMRSLIAHKPLWHDYGTSMTAYNMNYWSDGDSFIVNDVGHPLEGGAYGRVFLQNDPRSFVQIGLHNGYWTSRLQALAWMTAWSTQFEIGPLSETTFGNQGGYYYSIGCGIIKWCLTNPPYSANATKHTGLGGVTNNTGWTDFVITPLVGLGWILGEDTIDRFIVTPIAREHRIFGGRVLRSALEPTRSFAALFAGKFPWMLPAPENNFVVHTKPKPPKVSEPIENSVGRYALGTQYTNITLPVLKDGSNKATNENLSGAGFTFDYNFNRNFAIDSSVNFLPGQAGTQPMMQGLFGMKLGARWNRWGLFAKVRPGFIYYENAWPGLGGTAPTSLTRFAWDLGGVAEIYTHRNGTIRVDAGTTLVRYLADYPDPHMSELGTVLSNQYYTNKGSLQFSTAYVYRF